MEIMFTRQDFRTYSTQVTRDDGVILTVPAFDHPDWLPHDLAHLVVEQELGLSQGFWGRVAAGAVYPGMTLISGRRWPHAAERSQQALKVAPAQGTESEVFVAVFLRITRQKLDLNWSEAMFVLKNVSRPVKAAQRAWQSAEVKSICRSLREAHMAWQILEADESLTYRW